MITVTFKYKRQNRLLCLFLPLKILGTGSSLANVSRVIVYWTHQRDSFASSVPKQTGNPVQLNISLVWESHRTQINLSDFPTCVFSFTSPDRGEKM